MYCDEHRLPEYHQCEQLKPLDIPVSPEPPPIGPSPREPPPFTPPQRCKECGAPTKYPYELCYNCYKKRQKSKKLLQKALFGVVILIAIGLLFLLIQTNSIEQASVIKFRLSKVVDEKPLQGIVTLDYELKTDVNSVFLASESGTKIIELSCKTKGNCHEYHKIPLAAYEKIGDSNSQYQYQTGTKNYLLCIDSKNLLTFRKCSPLTLNSLKFNAVSEPTNDATIFECPFDFKKVGSMCEKIKRCTDGTEYDACTTKKPLFCNDGNLVLKSTVCGCPADLVIAGEDCISRFATNPKTTDLQYVLRGTRWTFDFPVYGGLNDYLATLPRSYICDPTCPTKQQIELTFTDEENQKTELKRLVQLISEQTTNKDDQARIAISIVQQIPYDWSGLTTGEVTGRYPYEVLYDNTGVCGEKAHLMAFLLRELGFGVVLFDFESQSHMAVGIKCPLEFSYNNSGYCFVEPTTGSIITDSEGNYVGAGRLLSPDQTFIISDGETMTSVSEEYQDFQEWKRITGLGSIVSQPDYATWQSLVNKYGIKIGQ